MAELKSDLAIHAKLKELAFEGSELYMARSVFNHVAVKQLVKCLEEEQWDITPRTSMGNELAGRSF